ncbi:MAG: DUF503 domain-containing protein [SAR202 cluster bacterium]|nr:DUF503 domain-containing protein [SAR202 cluster bacterium]MDP7225195.1 DUF503 domain-containing protein [SAR202 cluster bacterium]MDP7412549.1 DUF503 domain-containing protein [SAR202 cluster bacterium]MDP7533614.1 DUF503 domain-containing protein [SAR202 cluster bacterium]|tara:strand:+ start:827 stop:1120 length:294 start_codon:yes stop_codon:yes gene_type:complete
MNVGVCKVTPRLPENHSLKGKRRVVSSLCSRVRNKFNVAVSEVGDNEAWQVTTIGITCVSNSGRIAEQILDGVISYIESSPEDIELLDSQVEAISGF